MLISSPLRNKAQSINQSINQSIHKVHVPIYQAVCLSVYLLPVRPPVCLPVSLFWPTCSFSQLASPTWTKQRAEIDHRLTIDPLASHTSASVLSLAHFEQVENRHRSGASDIEDTGRQTVCIPPAIVVNTAAILKDREGGGGGGGVIVLIRERSR